MASRSPKPSEDASADDDHFMDGEVAPAADQEQDGQR